MGFISDFSRTLGIKDSTDGYGSYDDEDVDDGSYFDDVPEERKPSKKSEAVTEEDTKPVAKKPVTPSSMKARKIRDDGMEVCVFKPTSVDESREIVSTLRSNRIVTLNLEGIPVEIAQRIIDFVGGATFALDGNLQKLSQFMFLLTPASVSVSGDMQDPLNADTLDSSLR